MGNPGKTTAIIYDDSFLSHDPGPYHPESSERLRAIMDAVRGMDREFEILPPRQASRDELLLVHDPGYIDRILSLNSDETVMLDPDTAFSPGSKKASLLAAGAVLEAVDKVVKGDFIRIFCAVRPPGHHAEPDRAMGFCIFNNIAIGAAHALGNKNIERVAIIDWDVHHGNGTQKAFYSSDRALYISLHQYPHYPGTGSVNETGEGEGTGYTINIPMGHGSSDGEYRKAFNNKILPALDDFRPELIFISAGFDAHELDPLAGIDLSTEFYGEMTASLRDAANRYCGGKIISVLEGGYNLDILRATVALHLMELAK